MVAIRHIACCSDGNHFVTAEFERVVSVWSLRQRTRLASFTTNLDFGGSRLAILPGSPPTIIAGAYHVFGIEAFAADFGSVIWKRPDLKKVQRITPVSADHVICAFEKGIARRVDALTGRDTRLTPGVKEVYPAWSEGQIFLIKKDGKRAKISLWSEVSRRFAWQIELTSFSILALARNEDAVLVSQVGGPITCFDRQGTLLWNWDTGAGNHALDICWSPESRTWFARVWHFEKQGGRHDWVEIAPEGYEASCRPVSNGVYETAFFPSGEALVTNTGQVLAIPSLELLWQFTE